jgi:hypothetical protein
LRRILGNTCPNRPEAASLLDDKVLDGNVEQNQVAFSIADQIEE